MKSIRLAFVGVVCVVSIQGCTYFWTHLTYEFEQQAENPHIHYQTGMRDVADRVAIGYKRSVTAVERELGIPFKEPQSLDVYILNSIDKYHAYSYASKKTRASAGPTNVYYSPKIRERIDTTEAILVHELTHIHLRQYIGSYRYVENIPPWFDEGLAVRISNGAGAENVSPKDAVDAIKHGETFSLTDKNWFNGLDPHMAYRQAQLFIDYLWRDRQQFINFYHALVAREDFNSTFATVFDGNVEHVFSQFIETL